jgi:hypothetical protein
MVRTDTCYAGHTRKEEKFRETLKTDVLTKQEVLMLCLDGKYLWVTEYEGERMKFSEVYIEMITREEFDLTFPVEIMWWFDNYTHEEEISWIFDLFPGPEFCDHHEWDMSDRITMVVNRFFNYHSYSISSEILKAYDPLTIYYYCKYSNVEYSPYTIVSHFHEHGNSLTNHNLGMALSINRRNLHEMKVVHKITYDDIDLERIIKILALGDSSENRKDNFQLALENGVSYPVNLKDLEDKMKNPPDREYWAFHLDERLLSWGLGERTFFHLEYIIMVIRISCDKNLIPAVGYETKYIPPLVRHGIFNWEELSLMRNTLLGVSLADHIMGDIRDDINDILMILPTSFPVSISMKDVEMNSEVYKRVKGILDIIYDMKEYKCINIADIKKHINLLDRKLLAMSKDDVDTWGNLVFIRCYPNHRLADIIYAIRMLQRDDAVCVIYEYIKSLDSYHMVT